MKNPIRARLIDLSFGLNRKQRVTIETDIDFRELFDNLKGADISMEVKKWRDPRSRDANAYCWVLLDKLAEALNTTKEDLYRLYIKRVGVFRDFHLYADEAKTLETAWSMIGTGWVTEQVDYTADGAQVIIRAYYGSSRYNTKQMSRLIDEIVEACKEQGIETLTPNELDRMKEAWNAQGNKDNGDSAQSKGRGLEA